MRPLSYAIASFCRSTPEAAARAWPFPARSPRRNGRRTHGQEATLRRPALGRAARRWCRRGPAGRPGFERNDPQIVAPRGLGGALLDRGPVGRGWRVLAGAALE